MSSFLRASKIALGGYNVPEYSKPGDALGFLSKDHIRLTAFHTIIFHRESLKDMNAYTSCRQDRKYLSVATTFTINITIKYLKTKEILNSKLGDPSSTSI
jgi:hypothetical protein